MKVLIVDENPADLLVQADLLGLNGCTVIPARSEIDGILFLAEQMPDLVLADLPRLEDDTVGGGTTLHAVAAIYGIPMIVVSKGRGSGTFDDTQGCAGMIGKPIDMAGFAGDVLRIAQSARR